MFDKTPFSRSRLRLLGAAATLAVVAAAPSVAGAVTDDELDAARDRVQTLTQAISDAETDLSELEAVAAEVQVSVGFRAVTPTVPVGQTERIAAATAAPDAGNATAGRRSSSSTGSSDNVAAAPTVAVSGASEQAAAAFADRWVDAAPIEQTTVAIETETLADQADAEAAKLTTIRNLRDQLEVELARLDSLVAERTAADELRSKADSAVLTSDGGPFSSTRIEPTFEVGRLQYCPVDGTHSFINSWGFGRSGGRSHKGVDMMAASGTPIVAPVDGMVTLRSNRVGGRSFHLEGDDGNYYYGTHMSAYGQDGWVRAGTVIGYVGDDGNAAGINHLHFEVHPGGGSAVNPYEYVTEVC